MKSSSSTSAPPRDDAHHIPHHRHHPPPPLGVVDVPNPVQSSGTDAHGDDDNTGTNSVGGAGSEHRDMGRRSSSSGKATPYHSSPRVHASLHTPTIYTGGIQSNQQRRQRHRRKQQHRRQHRLIIKGEVHNVLTAMRCDPALMMRPEGTGAGAGGTGGGGIGGPNQFRSEVLPSGTASGRDAGAGSAGGSAAAGESHAGLHHHHGTGQQHHPLFLSLRDLSDLLCNLETGTATSGDGSGSDNDMLHPITYLSPFATAVSSREMSASITGAALDAMHKFILYGFLDLPSPMTLPQAQAQLRTTAMASDRQRMREEEEQQQRMLNQIEGIREGITVVARSVRHCTFEEEAAASSSSTTSSRRSGISAARAASSSSIASFGGGGAAADDRSVGSSMTARTAETTKTGGAGGGRHHHHHRGGSSRHGHHLQAQQAAQAAQSTTCSDEAVVLKLLMLASTVVRCSAGELLNPADVVGMFDTCLHVAVGPAHGASDLLRGAAGDSLGHIILCVFDRAGGVDDSFGMDHRTYDDAADEDNDEDGDDEDGSGGGYGSDEADVRLVVTAAASSGEESDPTTTATTATTTVDETATSSHDASSSPTDQQQQHHDRHQKRHIEHRAAVVAIMSRLASMTNPMQNSPSTSTSVLALTLINIALETSDSAMLSDNAELVAVVQNALCRHLLQLSTTLDPSVLGLTLRVIFNLFVCLKDHLKVQLEVFLTSVHLRILDPRSQSSPELQEVVLESLLEFCHEPSLMQDLYLNYDCDMQCSNLFETICTTLAAVASPLECEGGNGTDSSLPQAAAQPPLNVLNKLAVEGLLVVIDSIARRCQVRPRPLARDVPYSASGGTSSNIKNVGLSFTEDDDVSANGYEDGHGHEQQHGQDSLQWLHDARARTEPVLHERKRHKHRLATVTAEFNDKPLKDGWIQTGERVGVLSSPATAESVADFLYSTPKLDKVAIGEYLSRGPHDKYPFNAAVLKCFVGRFNFGGMSFSEALRTFLKKFRLPGEAQCIDRLMESFAAGLYEHIEKARQRNDGDDMETLPFKNADAAFVLAFSTIMLNTDLHNPTLRDDRRMTIEQFIRNNRGINDGENLPEDFLTSLYYEIKKEEIQVQKDLSDVLRGHDSMMAIALGAGGGETHEEHWALLSAKAAEVAQPFFTPTDAARRAVFKAGANEHMMFTSFAPHAIRCLSSIFARSWDDALVVKTLKGFKQIAKISVYFNDMDETFNNVVHILLSFGRDYITSVAASAYAEGDYVNDSIEGQDDEETFSGEESSSEEGESDDEDHENNDDDDEDSFNEQLASQTSGEGTPVPHGLLASNYNPASTSDYPLTSRTSQLTSVQGSAAHRGLLSLDCGLTLVRTQPARVREAWPVLIGCMLALRDAKALPPGLGTLDDFRDEHGVPLPSSPFAVRCEIRTRRFFSSLSSPSVATADSEQLSGFWSMFRRPGQQNQDIRTAGVVADNFDFSDEAVDSIIAQAKENLPQEDPHVSSFAEELISITQAANLNQVLYEIKDPQVVCVLLDSINTYEESGPGEDLLFEQHAVFALELAFRSLIANRDRGVEIFPLFMERFEKILSVGRENQTGWLRSKKQSDTKPINPYLMERVAVTILRSCIHMYDIREMRPYLRTSLLLLFDLPPLFIKIIADRLGLGLAVVLRTSYFRLESADEWRMFGDLLEAASRYHHGRPWVFDGITSCIKASIPAVPFPTSDGNNKVPTMPTIGEDGGPRMSFEGATVLARLLSKFVFGTFEKDTFFSVPAMLYLERVYWYVHSMSADQSIAPQDKGSAADSVASSINTNPKASDVSVRDQEMWQSVCMACYSVSLQDDSEAAVQGAECLERFILTTRAESVSSSHWIAILDAITMQHPPVQSQEVRTKLCQLLCKLLLKVIPHLSEDKSNWDPLTSIVNRVARIVAENLREGRKGSVSPLFESTVQAVTNLSNVLSISESDGDGEGFSQWAGETLFEELEKVGACGGSASLIAATRNSSERSLGSVGSAKTNKSAHTL